MVSTHTIAMMEACRLILKAAEHQLLLLWAIGGTVSILLMKAVL